MYRIHLTMVLLAFRKLKFLVDNVNSWSTYSCIAIKTC